MNKDQSSEALHGIWHLCACPVFEKSNRHNPLWTKISSSNRSHQEAARNLRVTRLPKHRKPPTDSCFYRERQKRPNGSLMEEEKSLPQELGLGLGCLEGSGATIARECSRAWEGGTR